MSTAHASYAQDGVSGKRTLTLTGTGEVSASPDVAYLNLSVETMAKNASQAVSENARKTNKVIDIIKSKLGDKDKIKTAGYNLSPVYEYNNQTNKSEFRGYRASNRLTVESHDLKNIGTIIDAAAEAGLNNIESLTFESTKRGELKKQALVSAVKDGRATADILANAAGVKVTRILQLSPTFDYPVPVHRDFAMTKEAAAPTPIEPGDLTISASVNVVFEIE